LGDLLEPPKNTLFDYLKQKKKEKARERRFALTLDMLDVYLSLAAQSYLLLASLHSR
jgi:hypothetical protein